jgi:Uma2 family endonuclease
MLQLKKAFISAEEYFEIEEASPYKSEYYHGEMFAVSGASFNHNVIFSNTFGSLHSGLRNTDCIVFGSDMKIQMAEGEYYVYPDISIVRGNIRFAPKRNDIITNPMLVIEILSESTKEYDMGLKSDSYRNIFSLKEYIVIDQYAYNVKYFRKNNAGQWMPEEFSLPEDTIELRSVDVKLSLKTIYHRITF